MSLQVIWELPEIPTKHFLCLGVFSRAEYSRFKYIAPAQILGVRVRAKLKH